MSLAKKIAEVKLLLHKQELKKSGINNFSKYSYFELVDFLPFIIEKCTEIGVLTYCTFGTDVARLIVIDTDTEEKFEVTSPMSSASLKGCHEVQNLGAVQTYLRRYLYTMLFDIIESDGMEYMTDTRAEKVQKNPIGEKVQKTHSNQKNTTEKNLSEYYTDKDEVRSMVAEFGKEGINWKKGLAAFKISSFSELKRDQMGDFLNACI